MKLKTGINKIAYSLLLMVTLVGCAQNTIVDITGPEKEKGAVTVRFDVAIPATETVTARSTTRANELITDLRLLVFDENNRFLYSRKTILTGSGTSIADAHSFTVELFRSSKKRKIHFIANHDWKGFKQDYFLEGLDEGQIIGDLDTSTLTYWACETFASANEHMFKGKMVALLRGQAKVSIENKYKNFVLKGFTAYNTYNKGTVASFYTNEQGVLTYTNKPTKPTEPQSFSVEGLGAFSLEPIYLFERSNQDKQPLFILLQGDYTNEKGGRGTYYYKIDLKYINSETGIAGLYDIIRNKHYKINIDKVQAEGYTSIDEAIANPAGNNIYASIELIDFPSIANGDLSLKIDQMAKTLVDEGQDFQTNFYFYVGKNLLNNNVVIHPSWGDDDPYLENAEFILDANWIPVGVNVDIKKIPTESTLEYFIDVIGREPNTDKTISRRIALTLRPPFEFDGELIRVNGEWTGDSYEDVGTLKLTIPKAIKPTALPFDISIRTFNMTPLAEQGLLLKVSDESDQFYYSYTVKDAADIGKVLEFKFKQNHPSRPTSLEFNAPLFNGNTLDF